MKSTWKMLFLLTAVSLSAEQENCLKDACGYLSVPSESISRLDSWNGATKVYIGFDESSNSAEGVVFKDNCLINMDHLKAIAFENDEASSIKNLIAERDGFTHKRDAGDSSANAVGSPRK